MTSASHIFLNERERVARGFLSTLRLKSVLPENTLKAIIKRAMARRPVHVLLMRSEYERAMMLMELVFPAVKRAEKRFQKERA